MRARTKLSMLILTNILMNLVTTSSLALVIAAAGQPSSRQQAKHRHKESAIAKLFNYDNYKASFGKSYSSDIENSNRRCYFYARALAVFVFAVNYKYRRIDYYKSLNFMSDWSRDQRAGMMGNGQAHGMMTRNRARLEAQRGGQLLAFTPAIGEKPEETLRNVLKLHARHNPRYRDLLNQLDLLDENKVASYSKRRSNRRQKRDVVTRQRRPRDFSFEELIESPRRKSNRVQNKARDETRAAEPQIVDNEDDEDRTENELMTQNNLPEPSVTTTTTTTTTVTGDLSDQLESVSLSMLDLSGIESDSLARQMKSALSFMERDSSDGDGDEDDDGDRYDAEQEDTIFFDHRDSGCLSGVRQQGTCGSCYAFASIAIAEWLYCKEKGQLVEFSEQYMVDCAGNWIEDMYGCNGARDEKVVEFIHNFGLELRADYLYKGRETGCPYNASTNLSTTGYIRMQLSLLRIPPAMWAIIVEQAPLYVLVQMDDTFLDYGGGVDDGSRCVELDEIFEQPDKYSFHAMVIVGHGRQDGQEYWLIRNSHGRRWGELGYYKLSKDAPDGCVPYREAFAYGTKNGFDYEVGASENPQYNRTVVEEAKSVFKSSRENQQKGGARRRGRRGKRN